MKVKTIAIVTILVSAFPLTVQAQDLDNKYQNYQVSCQSGADCNDFDINYDQQPQAKDQISQRTRERRTRSSSLDSKYYAGGNIGLFLPGDDLDVGFGLGGLFGYNVTENISAELEVFDYFGGSDIDDLGYNVFATAANGVYKLPFGEDEDSFYGFAGAGVGIGIASSTGDVADEAEDAGADTSDTGFLFQGKVGAGYPLTEQIDLTGQFRYVNISDDLQDGDGFSLDAGARYNF
jgi:hypothetical protein